MIDQYLEEDPDILLLTSEQLIFLLPANTDAVCQIVHLTAHFVFKQTGIKKYKISE